MVVMDPLSAFSVACNVLQMIETGVKLLSKAEEYLKAESGLLAEEKELRDVLQSLHNLNTNLSSSLPEKGATRQYTSEETLLLEANCQCQQLSKEFINFLDSLKLNDRRAMLDILRASIKAMWYQDKIEAIKKALSQARDNLNVMFLVYMNSKQTTQAEQHEIIKNTTRVEGSILSAVRSTSHSIQDDIKLLAQQLGKVSLDSVQQMVAQFTASHRDLLEHLSNQFDSILASQTDFQVLSDKKQVATACQSILDSLYFPQIRHRRDHIPKAHNETYQWILEPQQQGTQCYEGFMESQQRRTQRYDSFISWFRDPSSESRIYWIYGKIGAGKTTLLRFLDDNIKASQHMHSWAKDAAVVRASCFFWNAGNQLQKSTVGLLRTLLTQLFKQTPDLIPRVVQPWKWQSACLSGDHIIDWTDSELQDCLREYILYTAESKNVFLLVDGLDEFEGTDEARQDLINLLVASATHENVKICLSSRPLNVFRDAFRNYPQSRIEDLTYNDICTYVRDQLHGNERFQRLMRYDAAAAESLVKSLISKAAGVFLWVRLVVRQLLKGIRDGDGIRKLRATVEEIPADLDEYFMRLMESIEPRYQQEASEFFQLALYNEREFKVDRPHSLLDFSFIEEGKPDFALDPDYHFSGLDFADEGALALRIESTERKLTSRCMGLLEYYKGFYSFHMLRDFLDEKDEHGRHIEAPRLIYETAEFTRAGLNIDFLHQPLRDFLLTPKVQNLLHRHTHGRAYDARMFFRNARLVQLVALSKLTGFFQARAELANYVLCTLAFPGYRDSPSAATVAALIRPMVEDLARSDIPRRLSTVHLATVLKRWQDYHSTFLTLAIDFGLQSYPCIHLTSQNVQSKRGRPILDYVLRARIPSHLKASSYIGIQLPDLQILNTILGLGADPNQIYEGVSVWAFFLCWVAVHSNINSKYCENRESVDYIMALQAMIQSGAHILLPKKWLSCDCSLHLYGEWEPFEEPRLRARFPSARPVIQGSSWDDTFYHVGDLLEESRKSYGSSVDTLKTLVQQREAQDSALTVSGQVTN